jgi:hypothetical protein
MTGDEDEVIVRTETEEEWAQYQASLKFALGYRARCPATSGRPRVIVSGYGRFRSNRSNATGKSVVHDAVTFLTSQGEAGRLDYARARQQGRPVGSGVVEATCKSLFNVRLKRGGARWREERAGRLIRLRALALSGRWSPAIALLCGKVAVEVRLVA